MTDVGRCMTSSLILTWIWRLSAGNQKSPLSLHRHHSGPDSLDRSSLPGCFRFWTDLLPTLSSYFGLSWGSGGGWSGWCESNHVNVDRYSLYQLVESWLWNFSGYITNWNVSLLFPVYSNPQELYIKFHFGLLVNWVHYLSIYLWNLRIYINSNYQMWGINHFLSPSSLCCPKKSTLPSFWDTKSNTCKFTFIWNLI